MQADAAAGREPAPTSPVPSHGRRGREHLGLARLIALGAGVYFLVLGGTDFGVGTVPGQMVNAVLGAWLLTRLVLDIGRDVDLVDALGVLVVAVVAVAAVASPLQRTSAEAAIAAAAWLGCFYYLRRACRNPTLRRAAIELIATVGVVLSVGILVVWGLVWVEWVNLGSSTFPPLDMKLPVGPFRHPHVIAMLVGLTLPAIWESGARLPWPAVRWLCVLAVVAVLFMSGGRGAWLAAAAATGFIMVTRFGTIGLGRRAIGFAALAATIVLLLVVMSGAGSSLAERLLTGETLAARLKIWEGALALFASDPITGTGLGTFPLLLPLSGYFDGASFAPRHADSMYIQTAMEGGLLLLTAAVALAIVVMRRIATSRHFGLAAWAIAFAAVSSLTDNPFDSPNIVLLVVFWAAIATPPRVRERLSDRGRSLRLLPATATLILLGLTMTSFHVGSLLYEGAKSASRDGDTSRAISLLRGAAGLDPGFALYRRDLGLAKLASGDPSGIRDLEDAHRLNPADDVVTRTLSLTDSLDPDVRAEWARRGVTINSSSVANLVTAWLTIGDQRYIDSAMWQYPWLAASPSLVALAPEGGQLSLKIPARSDRPQSELAAAWTAAFDGRGIDEFEPEVDAFSSAMHCDYDGAVEGLQDAAPATVTRVVVEQALRIDSHASLAHLALLNPSQALLAIGQPAGIHPDVGGIQDRVYYHRIPGDFSTIGPALPTSVEALSVWMQSPADAATSVYGLRYPDC